MGYNAISNGGNQENQWHTMSRDEWAYLLHVRNTASGIRFARATVNGRLGIVVLPDHWKTSCYQLGCVNDIWSDFNSNIIPLSDWQRVLEPSGAVFLPEAGARTIDGVFEDILVYHTSTAATECAYLMQFGGIGAGAHRGDGFAVRLVREVK